MEDKRFNKTYFEVITYLPKRLQCLLRVLPPKIIDNLTEIRLRSGRPVTLTVNGQNLFLSNSGNICYLYQNGLLTITTEEIADTFSAICDYSVYAFSEQIKEGFVTLKNGCRIGISGTAVYENGEFARFKNISSLNFRIAKEFKDSALLIVKEINGGMLIAGPPSSGKTTLLRDAIRLLSVGTATERKRIALIDSRNEVAAVSGAEPKMDIGPLTDVLTSLEKVKGIEIALRTLNPDIIACDEITDPKEAKALVSGFFTGVDLLSTVHVGSIDELYKREPINIIIKSGAVKKIAFIEHLGAKPIIISAPFLKGVDEPIKTAM